MKFFVADKHQCTLLARLHVFLLALLIASLLASCGDSDEDDPLVEELPIAFVVREEALDENDLRLSIDARTPDAFYPGAQLMLRNRAATSSQGRLVTRDVFDEGALYDVKDLEVSFDGDKLLFALRAPEIENAAPEDQPTWNIWEYQVSSGSLRRIISSDLTAEAGQDVAPHYLPDGRIIFSSNRQRLSKALLLDENKPQFEAQTERFQEDAFVLHVMNDDGSGIEQVSFNQSHDLDPVVLSSGKVAFTRWDHFAGDKGMHVYQMNPDGSGLELLYGKHSHFREGRTDPLHFLKPRELPSGQLLMQTGPYSREFFNSELVSVNVENFIENFMAVDPLNGPSPPAEYEPLVLETGFGDELAGGGRVGAIYPLYDGTNRALVGWNQCRIEVAGVIEPCTAELLAAFEQDQVAGGTTYQEAPPLYGLWMFDYGNNTQLPILRPAEGKIISEVVAVQPRPVPFVIQDLVDSSETDPALLEDGMAILHIRSVYDFNGSMDLYGSSLEVDSLQELANPAVTTGEDRPARFLRLVKAVSIPDRDVLQLAATDFGRSAAQGMKEILGYVPVQPDGSVRVKVPANLAFGVSVVDENGRRISERHETWLQMRPGEVLECKGCHTSTSGFPHGRMESGLPSINPGAETSGLPFPNTGNNLVAEIGETMAETISRRRPGEMALSRDVEYHDIWTNLAVRDKDEPFAYSYDDLETSPPVSDQCMDEWTAFCRIVINYETHIHPLWSVDRGENTCTNCHADRNAGSAPMVPAGQLDLTDGLSSDNPAHYKSYRELLFNDLRQIIQAGSLIDEYILVEQLDANGNVVVDENGDPVLVQQFFNVNPPMDTSGALASDRFFSVFNEGGSHEGWLTSAELRLLSEWLDIGAQYYNNPFDVVQD